VNRALDALDAALAEVIGLQVARSGLSYYERAAEAQSSGSQHGFDARAFAVQAANAAADLIPDVMRAANDVQTRLRIIGLESAEPGRSERVRTLLADVKAATPQYVAAVQAVVSALTPKDVVEAAKSAEQMTSQLRELLTQLREARQEELGNIPVAA
jgi:hypothetical protein